MKIHKIFPALIGFALLLQACGNSSTEVPATPSPTQAIIPTQPPTAAATDVPTPGSDVFAPIPFRSGFGFRAPALELYFNNPSSASAQNDLGGVDAFLAASIVAAKTSVDVALRSLTLDTISNALVTVHNRGVPVRIVTDTDSLGPRYKFLDLQNAGIPVIDDQQTGLMNNRFIVIDHNQVWTGSLNFDTTGVFREDADMIRIYSADLAEDYTKEFEEMFVNKQFGPLVVPETPKPSVVLEGVQVDVLFSPDDVVGDRLMQLLNDAQQSIYFAAYAFAYEDLGKVIENAAAKGVKVSGVLDFDQVDSNHIPAPNPNQLSQLSLFKQAGLDVRLDGGPEAMNDKFIIIDGKIVVLGSYDFTLRAENENDENVLVIHSEAIAQKFMDEFQRIYANAKQ